MTGNSGRSAVTNISLRCANRRKVASFFESMSKCGQTRQECGVVRKSFKRVGLFCEAGGFVFGGLGDVLVGGEDAFGPEEP